MVAADVRNKPDNLTEVQGSLAVASMKEAFREWLTTGKIRRFLPSVCVSCIDKASEYALQKNISTVSFWDITQHSAYKKIYVKVLGAKLFRKTESRTYKAFIVAGQLYYDFLKEKEWPRKNTTLNEVVADAIKADGAMSPQPAKTVDPEDVISWLVTQPNKQGTLYLENVVRQYMDSLRSTPKKLAALNVSSRDVFACQTVAELSTLWNTFKAAPNYVQLNIATSGSLSAGLACLQRYLEHRSTTSENVEPVKEPENRTAIVVPTTVVSHSSTTPSRVDFCRPELCALTRPLSCTIRGKSVALAKWSWAQLLVAITEFFIAEQNPNLAILERQPLYGSQTFLMPSKAYLGASHMLENGKWIFTNYNPKGIVKIIGQLCRYCGVSLDDVVITYSGKDYAPERSVQLMVQEECSPSDVSSSTLKIGAKIKEDLTSVLNLHFPNGFRMSSTIELARFRNFAVAHFHDPLMLSDEDLSRSIAACGMNYEGKVYIVSLQTKERIKQLAEEYYAKGAQAIFYEEFYAKNESWLFSERVVSLNMLVDILREEFPQLYFAKTYFGHTAESVSAVLKNEILRVWGDDVLLTYELLAARLEYIPMERLKGTLGQSGDFVWSSVGTFSHVSKITITEEEREAIREATRRGCRINGYVAATELPLGVIVETNCELSMTAIHDAVFRICLADNYDKRGKVIARKGDTLDALAIMKDYCRTIDRCSLDDLLRYEKELTGENHRWIPMEAGNAILVRVDKEAYVKDRYVDFDIEAIDETIERFVKGDYLPLKSFTTFGSFPCCGQMWNLFLLESYCRRFSRKFRFDAPSVNSRNAGAVIRKSCALTYVDLMTDAVAKSGVPLTPSDVGLFLYNSGYIGKRTTTLLEQILTAVKNKLDVRS